MERLTYRDANGELWYSDNGTERDRLHRLAAYEDTGLAPVEVQQMRWIPVEERLSPPNVRVLAYRPDEDDNSPYKYTNMWGWAVKESIRHKGITHWMPLPAPPDKDNHVPAKAPNEPLTIEQLREMKDEPAYLKVFDPLLKSGWHIIKAVTKDKIIFRGWQTVYVPIDGMGVNYNLYRCPPEGIQ